MKLLQVISDENLGPFMVDQTSRQKFLKHPNREVRSLARETLKVKINPDRAAALTDFQVSLKLDGDSLA